VTAQLPRSPRRRLRRGAWRSASFASLDFETTGLDYLHDEVVSFGVVPIRAGRISVGASLHQLVEPMIPPSAASVKVLGMRSRDTADSPTAADARGTLRVALDGCFILSWYAPVEIAFLGRMFEGGRRRFRRRTIDVRELAIGVDRRRGYLSEAAEYSLSACASRYGVPAASPHDVLDDALVTAQVFLVLAARLEREGFARVGALLHAGRA
jgi:DNA polymerase III subunit epsilon